MADDQHRMSGLLDTKPLLVVLCGLPGAGKSTLAKKLAHRGSEYGMRVACFHFDDWMTSRRGVVDNDDKDGNENGEEYNKQDKTRFDPGLWKSSRKRCMEAARDALQSGANLVILDDTMHYSSMRLQCWKLARECGSMYCQVYVDLPMEDCLTQNARRDVARRIPEAVMERMGCIFESPKASNAWEARTVSLRNSQDVWNDIQRSKVEAPPLASDRELDPMMYALTTETVTHQVDIQSRRLLSEYIRRLKPSKGQDVRDVAGILNAERRTLLAVCRQAMNQEEEEEETGETCVVHAIDDPEPTIQYWISKFQEMCVSRLPQV